MRAISLIGSAIVLAATVAGCSSRNPNAPGSVSGTVTYKNSPVPAGSVTFYLENNGGIYAGALDRQGRYEINDIPAGKAVVTVDTEAYNPKKKTVQYDPKGTADYAKRMATEKPMKETPAEYVAIPKQYSDHKKTPLTATIEASKQIIDFALTD